MQSPVYAVVMAGGQGTRFWPLSRAETPKQFLRLDGEKSLLQRTAERLVPLVGWSRVLVVTHEKYARRVRQELPALPQENVLAEPEAKNTLPCLLLAAEWIRQQHPEAVMIAVPADHVVRPATALRRTLRTATRLARTSRRLVTIGIAPTRPETGYGYIQAGAQWQDARSANARVYVVRRFREKPNLETAARFLRKGGFLWNSGMFVWRVDAFREAAAQCAPEVVRAFVRAFAKRGFPQPGQLQRLYRALPPISVDSGVLEPLSQRRRQAILVVEAAFQWNDIGNWSELGAVVPADTKGNVVRGRAVVIDGTGCVVWSPERIVALIGLEDAVVVDTPDAVLVCAKERTQAVRKVIEELRRRGWRQHL